MKAMWVIIVLCSISFLVQAKGVKKENYIVAAAGSDGLHKKSRGGLKEALGEEVRNVFHTTVQLMGVVGDAQMALSQHEIVRVRDMAEVKNMQEQGDFFSSCSQMHLGLGEACKAIASMQRMFSTMLESLFDNKAPFRRATMPSLRTIIDLVKTSQYKLTSEMRSLKGVIHLIKKNALLKNIAEDSKAMKQTRQMVDEQKEVLKKVCANLEQDALVKQL